MNGHVGSEIDGFEGVHGGFGFGKRNVESEMILETTDALNLAVLNTWFKKEESLVTYENGECKTVVDYILSRKVKRKWSGIRKMVRDVNVVKVDLKERLGLMCKVPVCL